MLFFLTKLISLIVSPMGFLLLLAGVGILLLWRKRWRQGRAVLSLFAVLAIASPFVNEWALGLLEQRFPQPVLPEKIDGIIILGGSVDPILSDDHGQTVVMEAASRLTEGIRLAKRHPEAKVLFTGGSGVASRTASSEARYVVPLLVDMGIPADRIVIEDQSLDTYQNAVFSKEIAKPQIGQTWVLVTSARHMPRSVGVFRKVGWPVIAYPVDYQTTSQSFAVRLSSLRLPRLAIYSQPAHEWQGLLFYWLTGRTDSLFPAPKAGGQENP